MLCTKLGGILSSTIQNSIRSTKLNQFPSSSSKSFFSQFTKATMVATTDICDANEKLLSTGELKVLLPHFKPYGRRQAFHGPVLTVRVFEDNVIVRSLLESTTHQGKVLVVDGGGSLRCALLGGNLGQIAQNNGWAGIVVNGCIRDVDEINDCDIGVRALGTCPVKSRKIGAGEVGVGVSFAGALINDGDWLWADGDGILVCKHQLSTTTA